MSVVERVRDADLGLSSDDVAVRLGPDFELSCEEVERLSAAPRLRVGFTDLALERMSASKTALEKMAARGDEIYGLTTGFGPHVKYCASDNAYDQGAGLIAHLGAGWGPLADERVVRAIMIVRAQAIAQGMSGIDPRAAEAFCDLLRRGVTPAVPEIGSVGASGDLIPLAHVARVITGVGYAVEHGRRVPAAEALAAAGLGPVELSGRDALAIVNGTALMTGYAALALARAERLVERAERLTGWIYRQIGCRAQALDERLHAARGHVGQAESARVILEEASSHGAWEDTSRPLQEVYSYRCAPQILGACRDQLAHARTIIERELAGVNDNPVLDAEGLEALHGGNFQGQQIAFAADVINQAVVQAAVLSERQLDALVNPELNNDAPLLLAWQPGATSGMAGAQITATAIVAEMRHHGQPVATSSIPTNGRNQDVVSMGALAGRAAYGQTDRLAAVLAATAIGIAQLNSLREKGRAEGRTTPTPAWMPSFEPFEMDRALNLDLDRLSAAFIEAA